MYLRGVGTAQCERASFGPATTSGRREKKAFCHLQKELTAGRAQLRADDHKRAQFLHPHPFFSQSGIWEPDPPSGANQVQELYQL